MRNKKYLLIAILALAIGFASVSTILYINGETGVETDLANFTDNVVFDESSVSAINGSAIVSNSGKTLMFTANEMNTIGASSSAIFKIKNYSQYNAKLGTPALNCYFVDDFEVDTKATSTGTTNDYVRLTAGTELNGDTILAGGGLSDESSITIEQIKSYAGDESRVIKFQCEINVSGLDSENSGIEQAKRKYKDDILNGTDPVLGDGMIPIKLANDGTVTYADLYEEWYNYTNKEWANSVKLVNSPSKTYEIGDTIEESDIESYLVWIPRYRYKIFNEGNYDNYIDLTVGESDYNPSLIAGIESKAQTIEIMFENKDVAPSSGTKVGTYLTHPAFTSFNSNGMWVGKFETGYKGATAKEDAEVNSNDSTKVIVKPNIYSWRGINVANIFDSLYNYDRTNDSHMMKNTEWGAVTYLSHSKYGTNKEITINNNDEFLTGYASLLSSNPGTYGHTSDYNEAYNTAVGYTASTTGNITGIYDMSGGANEYMAGYLEDYGVQNNQATPVKSGFASDPDASKGAKYFDVYSKDGAGWTKYSHRILGDATGEMGPFNYFFDKDKSKRSHNSWYGDHSAFVDQTYPWILRGGGYNGGVLAGQFYFLRYTGEANSVRGSRLILAPAS